VSGLRTRGAGATGVLALAGVAPVAAAHQLGFSPASAVALALGGLGAAVDSVGWVLLPQLVLAVAICGRALDRLAASAFKASARREAAWLDPAIESALLLGMLGTVSGMVRGFAGVSPDELEPGPLVHALGTALRSSFVGFAIALVGVWVRGAPAPQDRQELAT
jgi:hypothetical protein